MPKIFPIYLFTGDDDYLRKEAVRKLKRALLGKDGSEAFNFNVYDAANCDIREVLDMLKSVPFISAKRLVLVTNIDAAGKEAQQAIVKYAKNPSKNSCLILESSRRESTAAFYKELAAYARIISFRLPEGSRITSWIRKETRASGKSIRHDAALLLKELKQDDINGLRCEIDKLVTYVGDRPAISREDVGNLVGNSASRSVFKFVDALGRKDAKDALTIAKEMLRAKKRIPEILGMIGRQFRRIKKAQEYIKGGDSDRNAGKKCSVPPFYIERFIREIKSFTPAEIEANINNLLDTDYSIKRGYLKPRQALETLVVKVCSNGK